MLVMMFVLNAFYGLCLRSLKTGRICVGNVCGDGCNFVYVQLPQMHGEDNTDMEVSNTSCGFVYCVRLGLERRVQQGIEHRVHMVYIDFALLSIIFIIRALRNDAGDAYRRITTHLDTSDTSSETKPWIYAVCVKRVVGRLLTRQPSDTIVLHHILHTDPAGAIGSSGVNSGNGRLGGAEVP